MATARVPKLVVTVNHASGAGYYAMAGQGFDPNVANCVANVIKAINFPAPRDGSAVTVNYPFTFRAAGQ